MFLCSSRYCLKCYFSKGVYSFTQSTVYIYIYIYMNMYLSLYIYIYIYIYIFKCIYIYGCFLPLMGQDSRELTGKHWVERESGVGLAKYLETGIELGSL